MSIKIEINLAGDFFESLLETALLGNEWAESRNANHTGFGTRSAQVRPHRAEGKPFDEGDMRNDWQTVARGRLEGALQEIVGGEVEINPALRAILRDAVVQGDPSVLGLDEADAVLQVALFGEIVFG